MAKQVYGFQNKADFDRAARAIRAVERMEPRPKKGKRSRRGGGGTPAAGLVGTFVIANEDVPAPTELLFSALPQSVKDAAGGVPNDADCYKLGKKNGKEYQVIRDEDTKEVYVIPLPTETDVPLYNSAGLVKAGVILQAKKIELPNDEQVRIIDVEKCG